MPLLTDTILDEILSQKDGDLEYSPLANTGANSVYNKLFEEYVSREEDRVVAFQNQQKLYAAHTQAQAIKKQWMERYLTEFTPETQSRMRVDNEGNLVSRKRGQDLMEVIRESAQESFQNAMIRNISDTGILTQFGLGMLTGMENFGMAVGDALLGITTLGTIEMGQVRQWATEGFRTNNRKTAFDLQQLSKYELAEQTRMYGAQALQKNGAFITGNLVSSIGSYLALAGLAGGAMTALGASGGTAAFSSHTIAGFLSTPGDIGTRSIVGGIGGASALGGAVMGRFAAEKLGGQVAISMLNRWGYRANAAGKLITPAGSKIMTPGTAEAIAMKVLPGLIDTTVDAGINVAANLGQAFALGEDFDMFSHAYLTLAMTAGMRYFNYRKMYSKLSKDFAGVESRLGVKGSMDPTASTTDPFMVMKGKRIEDTVDVLRDPNLSPTQKKVELDDLGVSELDLAVARQFARSGRAISRPEAEAIFQNERKAQAVAALEKQPLNMPPEEFRAWAKKHRGLISPETGERPPAFDLAITDPHVVLNVAESSMGEWMPAADLPFKLPGTDPKVPVEGRLPPASRMADLETSLKNEMDALSMLRDRSANLKREARAYMRLLQESHSVFRSDGGNNDMNATMAQAQEANIRFGEMMEDARGIDTQRVPEVEKRITILKAELDKLRAASDMEFKENIRASMSGRPSDENVIIPVRTGASGESPRGMPLLTLDYTIRKVSPSEVLVRMNDVRLTREGQARLEAERNLGKLGRGTAGKPTMDDLRIVAKYLNKTNKTLPARRALADPFTPTRKRLEHIHDYLVNTRKWLDAGRKGDAPQPHKDLEGLPLHDALAEFTRLTETAQDAAMKAAANRMPHDSAAAEALRSDNPAHVREVLEMLDKSGTLVDPVSAIGDPVDALPGSTKARLESIADRIEKLRAKGYSEDEVNNVVAKELLAEGNKAGDGALPHKEVVEALIREGENAVRGLPERMLIGERGIYDMAGADLIVLKPTVMDRMGLRQNIQSLDNMLIGQFGVDLGNLALNSAVRYRRLMESSFQYFREAQEVFNVYLQRLHDTQGKKAQIEAMLRVYQAGEGRLDMESLSRPEALMVERLRHLYDAFEDALGALGIKSSVKKGSYMTRIFKNFEDQNGLGRWLSEGERSEIKTMSTRFAQRRKSINVQDYDAIITDVGEIMSIYIPSVTRMIAFRPYADTIIAALKKYGVKAPKHTKYPKKSKHTKNFFAFEDSMGTVTKLDWKENGIPYETAKWLASRVQQVQGQPGTFSRYIDEKVDGFIAGLNEATGGRASEYLPESSRQLFAGMQMLVNAFGVGGISIGGPLRNILTGGLISFADPAMGPKWFAKGIGNLVQRGDAGKGLRLNTILHEIGILDATFVQQIRREVEQGLGRVGFKAKAGKVVHAGAAAWLKMFESSEVIIRGATAIGAYEHALERGLANGLSHAAAKTAALTAARKVAARTQTNFDAVTGARAFSGSAGKLAGQFQRFGWNYADWFWGLVQRSGVLGEMQQLRGRSRMKTMDELLGFQNVTDRASMTDIGLKRMGVYLFAVTALGFLGNAAGMDFSELHGPMGSMPAILRYGASRSVELAGEAADMAFDVNDKTLVAATRGVTKYLGADVMAYDGPSAMLDSMSPTVGAIYTLTDLALRRGVKSAADYAKAAADVSFFTSGGVFGQRVVRMMQEEADGYTVSRTTGHRLTNRTSPGARTLRLLGIQSADVAAEYEKLGTAREVASRFNKKVETINTNAREMLDEGDDPAAVYGSYLAALWALGSDFSVYVPVKNAETRWNSLVRDWEDRTGKTLRQRIEEKLPFKEPE